jgi:hypothetical protein
MIKSEDVFKKELKAISAKREKCNSKDGFTDSSNLFGISLSGGGIRSATINLGILNILNKCGILPLADFLSTVSGGGYIGEYIHSKLRENGSTINAFNTLFSEEDVKRLREHGHYLSPGKGIEKRFNKFRLYAAFVFSLFMNWIWVFSLFFTLYFFAQWIVSLPGKNFWDFAGPGLFIFIVITIGIHFFLHGLRYIKLWSSDALYFIEAILLVAIIVYGIYKITGCYPTSIPLHNFLIALAVLFVIGFFANPNILTMHRFYRDRLADAYLKTAGKDCPDLKLSEIKPEESSKIWGCAPYPLINTCLNVLDKEDDNFKGTKTCDYFLLSPLYCGSVLTGYIETSNWGYRGMTLSTAVAISGAALNPNMGLNSNRFMAFFMTLFNLRLGYWTVNPKGGNFFKTFFTWWPNYHLWELFCKSNTKRWRVNITDGGHIENLGIYELLKRKCKLIIAIDASADSKYSFSDLENLIIRARNELGIEIKFRDGLEPETIIRPSPSNGFSISHFSIADIKELPGANEKDEKPIGLIVYVKSSMRATQKYKKITKSDGFLYKMYHPAFPHESTADQFFDEDQWEAYYDVGRFMAGDLLQTDVTDEAGAYLDKCHVNTIRELYDRFDRIKNRTDMDSYLKYPST